MPLVSIVLPTNGLAEIIRVSIASVLAQTLQDFELIVVGDGCEDGTAEVVADFEDERIVWLDLPKAPGSGYANRNVALGNASGDIVAYAQHDDLWFPNHLERIAAHFKDTSVDFAHARFLWITDDGYILPEFSNLTHHRMQKAFLRSGRGGIVSSFVAHRRSTLEHTNGFDENILRKGDLDLWARIIRKNRAGVRTIRQAAGFHFRAQWRNKNNWGMPRMQLLREAAGKAWPADLRLEIDPDGPPPQQQIYAMMKEDPIRFATKLERTAEQFQDMIAWRITRNSPGG